MNLWWTVHECLFMWTFHELLMNCSWTIFFHNKFLNSSWTVMVNCSWTLVHEPTMRVFYELFMNCSWTFMNVHEQFIKSWTTFHRGCLHCTACLYNGKSAKHYDSHLSHVLSACHWRIMGVRRGAPVFNQFGPLWYIWANISETVHRMIRVCM